ncbi:aminobutyraldehyde dehydrogenase [Rhizobium sp. SSA_523]|uniref:aminobutyraldehyde dehydrogenase n=1 Tax=Rhizobium sp. SSA_523 TaxID=2952477 RepID=UPI002090E8A0|nr:aminobutyraldehyde dehydrogenase [Rhizobium sp. SSA_523]MCO5733451.1 aminobutyraldehyde dehydrogenase [Rhizobium sp. SSA_523]WKC21580.1 aminobutyraldehyde dehydrogenase [Rhizobium sp. SSA_523]
MSTPSSAGFDTRLLINGSFISGEARSETAFDPARGTILAEVPSASLAQVESAIAAASQAFTSHRRTTPKERSLMLLAIADRILREAEDLARVESLNAGKPLRYVKGGELANVADVFRFFAGAVRTMEGTVSGNYRSASMTSLIRRDPVGVVASIAPWNYPLLMAAWKLAPAIAAGNTVVIKPSEHTPLSLIALGRILNDILPPGVVNIVCGNGPDVGQALISHPDVRMVSLTGDVRTGRAVLAAAAGERIKRTHLELGGKAPVIVLKDADIDSLVSTLREASFYNAGQDCTAACRILVDRSLAGDVEAAMEAMVASLIYGDPERDDVEFGPVISARHLERVSGFVDRARDQGCQILAGGERSGTTGFFYAPTLVRAPFDAEIVQKEVFGPVVTITAVDGPEDAVRLANSSEYGLASSVWSADQKTALTVANALEYGVTWVNTHGVFATEMPHGGMKNSGYGSDLSMQSLLEYTQTRHIMLAS